MIQSPSFCSIDGFYAWATTLRISFPLDVSKPVFITTPIQHRLTGGLGTEMLDLVAVLKI